MAKAGNTPNTSDQVWLSDALRHVTAAVGSRPRAEIKLQQWLAAGELPWIAGTWIPRQKYVRGKKPTPVIGPSNGDPVFWRIALDINWDGSSARESVVPFGAKAQGIQVSWARLLELQPGATLAPRQITPAEQEKWLAWARKPAEQEKLPPDRWLAWAREKYPREPSENPGAYIARLYSEMQKAKNVTKAWEFKTFHRRYYDQIKDEREAAKAGR